VGVFANATNNECTWINWSGNSSVFSCNGMPVSNYTARCAIFSGTAGNCCADNRTIIYSVVPTTTTSTSTTTTTTTTTSTTTTISQITLSFQPPTSANGSTVTTNWVQANVSINASGNLDTFKFNWNSTSYSFFDSSLVLASNFNNNSAIGENSTRVVDISRYGNNATCSGSTCPTFNSSGRFAGALNFDNNDDLVQLATPLFTGTGDFTILAWINRSNSSGAVDYICGNYGTGGCTGGIEFYVNNDVLGVYISSGVSGVTNITRNVWYHVSVTRTSGAIKLYVNGIQDGSGGTLAGSITGSCNWGVGNGPNYVSEAFGGLIDEVRVYNRSLNASEILMSYQSEFQKYNSTEYRFYKNITDLVTGTYSYYAQANNTAGNSNITDNGNPRYVNIIVTNYDGNCNSTGTINLNTQSCSGRATPDAIAFTSIVNSNAGQNSIQASSTITGINAGDRVIIIDLKGSSIEYTGVGKYEIGFVQSVAGNTITLTAPLANSYSGTTHKIVIQRLPTYNSVTLVSGGVLTANSWSGTAGGIFAINSIGTVTISGTVDMNGKGYRNGAGCPGLNNGVFTGTQGESYAGNQNISTAANFGGGGSGSYDAGGSGGGYNQTGLAGGQATGGIGTPGTVGGSYSNPNLTVLLMGSGGGGGGGTGDTCPRAGGAGGIGGGIIFINASVINLTSTGVIQAKGMAGAMGNSYCSNAAGSGGSGSGGSVLLTAGTKTLSGTVSVVGGAAVAGRANGGYTGGTGGAGSGGYFK
jgi:hypothetical protein